MGTTWGEGREPIVERKPLDDYAIEAIERRKYQALGYCWGRADAIGNRRIAGTIVDANDMQAFMDEQGRKSEAFYRHEATSLACIATEYVEFVHSCDKRDGMTS